MKKKILLIGGGSALLLLCMLCGAIFAGPLMASAQSSTPTTSAAGTPCQQYQQNLANSLHISTTTLHQDQVAAKEAVVAQEVKDGQLTQAQANAIDTRLAASQACSGKHQGIGLQRGILRQTLKGEQTTLLTQVAAGLHLSTTQLQSDLQNGQTLVQIAKTQHMSESQLHTIVVNAADTALSQAQQAGTITAKQASAFMAFLKNHPGVVNRWLHHDFAKTK
jgi:hypothetical protein